MEPTITDWLMVAITAVYVIATLCIMKSNKIAANASKEQLEESKIQFDEMRRLNSLPFLQLELRTIKDRAVDYEIELPIYPAVQGDLFSSIWALKNIGNGTAMNIIYTWKCKSSGITNIDYPPVAAIRYGDEYKVEIITGKATDEKVTGKLTFEYQDLIGNEYRQTMYVSILGFDIAIETDIPRLACE